MVPQILVLVTLTIASAGSVIVGFGRSSRTLFLDAEVSVKE